MVRKIKNIFCIILCSVVLSLSFYNNSLAGSNDISYCGDKAFVKKMKSVVYSSTRKASTAGKTYYVSTTGNDSWAGTKKKPFATFLHAMYVLKPGDTLYIRGGVYTEQMKIPKRTSGTAAKYITICSMPGEQAIIDGSNQEEPDLIDVYSASYLKISNLELRNAVGDGACGIVVNAESHHLIISDNIIYNINIGQYGKGHSCANPLALYGESPKRSIDNIFIYNNKIYDCETGWTEAISIAGNVKDVNVLNNTVARIGNIGICFGGNYGYCSKASIDFPRNCLVYNNNVSECVSPIATSYGIYVDGGQKITIQNNIVSKCSGGIEVGAENNPPKEAYSTSNITVKDNEILDNVKHAIAVGGYREELGWVKNVKIINNICKNNGINRTIVNINKCKDITFSGNLFYNDSGNASIIHTAFSAEFTKNIKFSDNIFYNGNPKDRTKFVYLGQRYSSFEQWLGVVGRNAGQYKQ